MYTIQGIDGPIKIWTEYDPKPIPVLDYDWSAYTTDYEPGLPYGQGRTEQDAFNMLLDELYINGEIDLTRDEHRPERDFFFQVRG